MFLWWKFTVLSEMLRMMAISPELLPSAVHCRISRSRWLRQTGLDISIGCSRSVSFWVSNSIMQRSRRRISSRSKLEMFCWSRATESTLSKLFGARIGRVAPTQRPQSRASFQSIRLWSNRLSLQTTISEERRPLRIAGSTAP